MYPSLAPCACLLSPLPTSGHCPVHGSSQNPFPLAGRVFINNTTGMILRTTTNNNEFIIDKLKASEPVQVDMPLVGFRAWDSANEQLAHRLTPFSPVRYTPTNFHLGSIGVGHCNWKLRGPMPRAECKVSGDNAVNPHSSQETPGFNCSCGYYACKTLNTAGHQGGAVKGAVLLWGKVIEHDDGYRAEYAQIIALLEHDNSHYFESETGIPCLSPTNLMKYAAEFGALKTPK